MPHTIILGAGLSGLWTAYTIKRLDNSHTVTILEKEAIPGGLFNSSQHFRTWFNHGLFTFPDDNPLVRNFPDQFTSIPVIFEKSIEGILRMFPVDPAEFHELTRLSRMPVTAKELIGLYLKRLTFETPKTLEQWLRRYMPEAWIEMLRLNDYIFKLMGYESQELSPTLGKQRLDFICRMTHPGPMLRHAAMKARLLHRRRAPMEPELMKLNALLGEGTGGISRKVADIVLNQGVNILYRSNISAVLPVQNGFKVVTRDHGTISGDTLVSTIPIETLQTLITGRETERKLICRDIMLLLFRFRQKMPENLLRVIYSFNRTQIWKRAIVRMIDPVSTGLKVEITLPSGTRMNPDQAAERVLGDFTVSSGLFNRATLEEWDHLMVSDAYPCLLKDSDSQYQEISDSISVPRLFSIGRQGAYKYWSTDHCIQSAEETGTAIVRKIHS
jgi:protoporphyrinogen oxidase